MEIMEGKDGCFSHQASTDILMESVAKAAFTFKDKPYFHFNWITSFTHESARASQFVDEPVLNLLRTLSERQLLNRTAFILMSDHGMTFGPYVQMEQGMLESRMPMLNIVFPDWFRKKYSRAIENMKVNTRRLSTPFDLHEAFHDLLDPQVKLSNSALERRETEFYSGSRGISLFLPIPLNRTCKMAEIDDHWCICWSKTPVEEPEADVDVQNAVNFSLSVINTKLMGFPMCSQLELESIVLARKLNPESTQFTGTLRGVSKYEVVFEVSPSLGIFEATVVLDKTKGPHMGGPISRINAYKRQGDCIDTTANGTLEIKSLCFCTF
jgi:hypothetical protein